MEQQAHNNTLLFRTCKRRKPYRQRTDGVETDSPKIPPHPPPELSIDELITSASTEIADLNNDVSVADILRQRKRNKRTTGVEFKVEGPGPREEEGTLEQVDGEDQSAGPAEGNLKRFSRQTGMIGDVDRHMMAYIDAALAKSRSADLPSQRRIFPPTSPWKQATAEKDADVIKTEIATHRQPATLGRLLEIDLGDEVRNRNVELTDRARRKLVGEKVEEEERIQGDEKGMSRGKMRLGRDGKPWRGRKRRGSDDIKRDQLVDEVLRENRLEHYEEPVEETVAIDDDQAADDRIAEAFRKEFMDAISARHRKKAAPARASNRAGAKKEAVLRGPKLGGSRSARAAMRETLLKNRTK